MPFKTRGHLTEVRTSDRRLASSLNVRLPASEVSMCVAPRG